MPDTALGYTDWLSHAPTPKRGWEYGYIDVPAFTVVAPSLGGDVVELFDGDPSVITNQFNYSASEKFAIATTPVAQSGFVACVKYRQGEVVTRYRLWDDVNFTVPDEQAPLYNGEVILPNFVIEIWSLLQTSSIAYPALATAIRLNVSIRQQPAVFDTIGDSNFNVATGAAITIGIVQGIQDSLPVTAHLRWDALTQGAGALSNLFDQVNSNDLVAVNTPVNTAAAGDWLGNWIDFNKADTDYFEANDASGSLDWNKFDFYLIASLQDVATNQVLYCMRDVGSTQYIYLHFDTASGKVKFSASSGSGVALADTDIHVFRVHLDNTGNVALVAIDGVEDSGTNSSSNGFTDTAKHTLGALQGPLTPTEMNFGGAVLFRGLAITSAQDVQIRNYLRYTYLGEIPFGLNMTTNAEWLDNT